MESKVKCTAADTADRKKRTTFMFTRAAFAFDSTHAHSPPNCAQPALLCNQNGAAVLPVAYL
jgi:hypothetical protein